jgi:hypothetical protein
MQGLFAALGAGEFLILLQGWLSYVDNFFTRKQMVAAGYGEKGLPFLAHPEMWTDVFPVTPLLAYLIYKHGTWSGRAIAVASAVSLGINILLHYGYVKRGLTVPGCHAHGGWLTPAGWVHMVYSIGAFTILLLYYFRTQPPPFEIMGVTVILLAHVVWGTLWQAWYLDEAVGWAQLQDVLGATVLLALGTAFNLLHR